MSWNVDNLLRQMDRWWDTPARFDGTRWQSRRSRRSGPVLNQGDDRNGLCLVDGSSQLLLVIEEEIEDVRGPVGIGTARERRRRSKTISADGNSTELEIAELRLQSSAQVLIGEIIDRSIVQNKSVSHDDDELE